jgi:hypothetical protein
LFFFVPGVNGLRVDVSQGSGGSSDSINYDFNVAGDASVDGKILMDKSGCHPTIKIIKPSKKVDYGDWNKKWWLWAFSMPTTAHPLYDTAPASEGQKGDVWFIGSGFVGGDIDRKITIPYGTDLFIPLFNVEASNIEGKQDGYSDLKKTVKTWMGNVKDLSATIDGSEISEKNFYHAPTDIFTNGPLPKDNVLQFLGYKGAKKGAIIKSAADGYYMMLDALPPGDHLIKWSSTWDNPDPIDDFPQNVEYKIHVKPKCQGGK